VVIAQPAEEVGEGAKAMIDAGFFKKFPRPDYALATHVAGRTPVGTLKYHKGYSLANVDYVDITVFGKGGHGAIPHTTVDPIVVASQIVLALQTLVSRETDPLDPAVVTVGAFSGGSKHNIIPEEVHLQITVRSFEEAVRAHLKEGIKRIAENISASARAPRPMVAFLEGVPSLYNDPALADELLPVFEDVVGKENVAESKKEMYGEDFSYFGYKTGIPIFMFWTGSKPKSSKMAEAMHSPRFAPEFEGTFRTGVAAMSGAVLKMQK
jgi:hippurate hydrolase